MPVNCSVIRLHRKAIRLWIDPTAGRESWVFGVAIRTQLEHFSKAVCSRYLDQQTQWENKSWMWHATWFTRVLCAWVVLRFKIGKLFVCLTPSPYFWIKVFDEYVFSSRRAPQPTCIPLLVSLNYMHCETKQQMNQKYLFHSDSEYVSIIKIQIISLVKCVRQP